MSRPSRSEPVGVTTPLKLAIWDVDGTIVDSRQVIQKAMDRAFKRAGLGGIDYDRTRTIVGLELGEAVARLAPPDYPAEKAVQLATFYKEAFVEQRAEPGFEEPLYDGVRDTIERLVEQGWLMGVATGKARRGLDIVFDHHDLHRYFDTFQTVDGGAGKPHPRMVLDAMRETGTDAFQAVMIGDTKFDMEMGRNAGVHTLGVSWGFHTLDEIAEGGAHSIHHDFAELDAALDAFAAQVDEQAA
jgi:phosphoglycolate phosphatase